VANFSRPKLPVVATCASGSGDTIAIIEPCQFRIYRLNTNSQWSANESSCMGKLEEGIFKFGLDKTQLTSQTHIFGHRQEFECGAVTDSTLAIGASGCLLIFSVGPETRPGMCVFKSERPDRTVKTLVFDPRGTELAALFTEPGSTDETIKFYSTKPLTQRFAVLAKSRKIQMTVEDLDEVCSAESNEVRLQRTRKFRDEKQRTTLTYDTRGASFSSDGRRLIAFTHHVRGSVLITMLARDKQNSWQHLGTKAINIQLDRMDYSCQGCTGLALFETCRMWTN
jgi:hypothetical protein